MSRRPVNWLFVLVAAAVAIVAFVVLPKLDLWWLP